MANGFREVVRSVEGLASGAFSQGLHGFKISGSDSRGKVFVTFAGELWGRSLGIIPSGCEAIPHEASRVHRIDGDPGVSQGLRGARDVSSETAAASIIRPVKIEFFLPETEREASGN